MDDEADLKKIVDVLNDTREENSDFQYQEFINFVDSDEDEDNAENLPLPPDQDYDFDKPFTFDISTLYKYNPLPSLKSEEKAVIDSCTDPDLKKVLLLNRKRNLGLIQYYKKFKDLLVECKQNILEKSDLVKQYYAAHKTQSRSSGTWRVGAPYFKDKGFYIAPLNDDALRKKNNNELNYYDLIPLKKWRSYECDRLMRAVKLNYNINQITELKKNIKLLTASKDENKDMAICDLELRLKELSDTGNLAVPPLRSDQNINWIRVAEVFVKDKHSDFECRSFWHLFVHPAVNKSKWTPNETKQLLELVEKYKAQNWDQIAKELGTNRTCLGVCLYYFANYHSTVKKGEFTQSEDRKLLELVNKYRMGNYIPWVAVVRHFENRTRAQLHHRFTYYLNQIDKKKGKFTPAEDIIVLLCVEQFGRNYKKCADFLPERSAIQIKTRYTSSLRGFGNKGTWTIEEDILTIKFVKKEGKTWSKLSKQIDRPSGQIRQRYVTLKTYLKTHPGATIEDVPRRKHKARNKSDRYYIYRQLVERLKNDSYIPSVSQVEEMLGQMTTPLKLKLGLLDEPQEQKVFTDIDDLLTEFFWNNSDPDVASSHVFKKTVDDVELLLDVLKVNLCIPDNIRNHSKLDFLDKIILTELHSRQSRKTTISTYSDCQYLVPPNFYTTTGIRGLLIKNYQFRFGPTDRIFGSLDISVSEKERVKSELNKELIGLDASKKNKVEVDRSLFFRRFLSLFKWPAVLTLEAPSKDLVSVSENLIGDYRPPVKRTYSRIRNNGEPNSTSTSQAGKVRILEEGDRQSLKLTPVTDKSVIMNLMKDNSKKLFCLDKVKCGNETRTRIKEVALHCLPSRSDVRNLQSISSRSISTIEDYVSSDESEDGNDNVRLETKAVTNYRSEDEDDLSEIDISDTTLMATSDIFETGRGDLMDLDRLTKFIKAEKHRE